MDKPSGNERAPQTAARREKSLKPAENARLRDFYVYGKEKVIPDGGMQDFSKKDYQNNLYLSNIAYYINLFG